MAEKRKVVLPDVVNIASGEKVKPESAQLIAEEPDFAYYDYKGHKWAIAMEPTAVTAESEAKVQALQFKMASLTDISATDALAMQEDESKAQSYALNMSPEIMEKITQAQREIVIAEAAQFAPAILGCNDPSPDHYPTEEFLANGGLIGKLQLEALRKWWNPTEPLKAAEVTKTEDHQSSD